MAGLFKEKASSKITRLHHKRQLFGQGRQAYRLRFDGMGVVKVPGAQVQVWKKKNLRGKASYKAKSSI
jgi:hypothetical protein